MRSCMHPTRNIATEYVQVPNRGMDSRAQLLDLAYACNFFLRTPLEKWQTLSKN